MRYRIDASWRYEALRSRANFLSRELGVYVPVEKLAYYEDLYDSMYDEDEDEEGEED